MARTKKSQKISKLKSIYKAALRWFERKVPKRISLSNLKKEYKEARQELIKTEGVELPKVQTIAKQQIEIETQQTSQEPQYTETPQQSTEPPLISFGEDYINNFKSTLKQILDDSLESIKADLVKGKGRSKENRSGYWRSLGAEDILGEYNAIIDKIDEYVSDYGYEATAQALKDSIALDYTQAIVFVPPSDTQDNFEITLGQITSMTIQSLEGMNS